MLATGRCVVVGNSTWCAALLSACPAQLDVRDGEVRFKTSLMYTNAERIVEAVSTSFDEVRADASARGRAGS
jgi:hypothetical protein